MIKKIFMQEPINISLEALKVAITQIGQKEDPIGSNSGVMVDAYLKSVGLDPGAAWCQAFLYWCYDAATKALSATGHGTEGVTIVNPVVRTAGVLDCWNRTAANKKIMALEAKSRPELVSPGNQIFFKDGETTGHTGIVEKVIGQDIYTIEGNTNSDGGREGYEVLRKLRKLSDAKLLGFAKYS